MRKIWLSRALFTTVCLAAVVFCSVAFGLAEDEPSQTRCIPIFERFPIACPLPFGGLPFGREPETPGPPPREPAALRIEFTDGLTELTKEPFDTVLITLLGTPGYSFALLADLETGHSTFMGLELDLSEWAEIVYWGVFDETGEAEVSHPLPPIMSVEEVLNFYFQAVSGKNNLQEDLQKSNLILCIVPLYDEEE
jgi:hypothetical protein